MVTVIQRFGSGVNLNVHFHTLVLDGVFTERTPGQLEFHAATPPSDAAVAQVLVTIRHRVQRLLARRGLEADAATVSRQTATSKEVFRACRIIGHSPL